VEVESEGGLYAGIGTSPEPPAGFSEPSLGGPGWRRYQARAGERQPPPRIIEAQAEHLRDAGPDFDLGDRCFHQKFGMGTIAAIDGDRLTIEFDHAGTKKVVAAYVQKA